MRSRLSLTLALALPSLAQTVVFRNVNVISMTSPKVEKKTVVISDGKIGSMFMSSTKSFLVTAKQLMRRIRDKVPYSQGDKMMLNAGGGWMVEGSPPRLMRDYNQLVDAYNRGAGI